MTNANVVTIAGRPHDIRCPQSGRTDVDDCCKPMVAFMATMEERERCAKLVNDWAKAYPASMFGEPEFCKHGPTVDSCSAKALRTMLPIVAEEILGHELDQSTECQHEWSGVSETTGLRVCLKCKASDWPHRRNRVCGFWTAGRPCVEREPCPKHGTMPTNSI